MRKIFTTAIICIFSALVSAQSMEFLDINRVKAAFWADGTMFWDKISDPLFEWPQDSNTHVNFVTGLWMGGMTSSDTLKGGYMRYEANGNDYYPGPLTITAGSIDSNTIALYDRVWKINKSEVDQYILCHCVDPGHPSCIGYTIPASILDWPGNPIIETDGDHLLMDPQLAPFHDDNADGVYDPNDCDYPLLKCDQALFFVFNDRGGLHYESLLPPMGVEVRATAYACSCDSLDDAIFLDYKIIYRGTDTLYQTFIGLHSDADIGGAVDDYAGTHVEEGYVYYYNGDGFDDSNGGQTGYGNLPPAHGMVYLEGPWMDSNGQADFWDDSWNPNNPPPEAIDAILTAGDTVNSNASYGVNGTGFNDTIVDNEKLGLTRSKYFSTDGFDPIVGNTYYLYQKAFWHDGAAQIYGGTGYPAGPFAGAPRSWFVWPGDSDPFTWGTQGVVAAFEWSEFNNGIGQSNQPADRRSVSASGPFTLVPGEINQITYSFVTARSTTMADSLSLTALNDEVINVKSLYYQGLSGCGNAYIGLEEEAGELVLSVYPNPADEMVWIAGENLDHSIISIFDMTGRLILQSKTDIVEGPISISIGSLAPGMYAMIISNGSSKKSMVLIKQ